MTTHFEPLRPGRSRGQKGKYEFTHGERSVCVYDIETLRFVKEIAVGPHPDCHATSMDDRFLYIACHDGLYCIAQDSLEVARRIEIPYLYAVNALPDGSTLLTHDQCGGVELISDITDMEKIHLQKRNQVIPDGKYRCEIGGKGNFIQNGRYYLCSGWTQSKMYLFDAQNGFAVQTFLDTDPILYASDDLVISADHTKAYTACRRGNEGKAHVAVIDIGARKMIKTIPTGTGTCGLTMTADERYVIASNDQDDSISVIDTRTDTVVNTPCAREGFARLGIRGYIQGLSCGVDDAVYVYGCSGNGAIVRFFDVAHSNRYVISYPGGRLESKSLEG